MVAASHLRSHHAHLAAVPEGMHDGIDQNRSLWLEHLCVPVSSMLGGNPIGRLPVNVFLAQLRETRTLHTHLVFYELH